MLDRIRGFSDILTDGIAAKPALYTRMRAFVRTKVLVSDSCRLAIATTNLIPTKRCALKIYNCVYDRANLGDENGKRLLEDIAHVTGIGISLNGERLGKPEYKPVASVAA